MSFIMDNGVTTIEKGVGVEGMRVPHPRGGVFTISVLKDGTIKYGDKIYEVKMPVVIRDDVVTFADGKTLPDVLGNDMSVEGERNIYSSSSGSSAFCGNISGGSKGNSVSIGNVKCKKSYMKF